MCLLMENTEHDVTDDDVLAPCQIKILVRPGSLQRQCVISFAPWILKALVFDFYYLLQITQAHRFKGEIWERVLGRHFCIFRTVPYSVGGGSLKGSPFLSASIRRMFQAITFCASSALPSSIPSAFAFTAASAAASAAAFAAAS